MADAKKPDSPGAMPARQARLAAALRQNLKRRKEQARQRDESTGPPQPAVHKRRPVR
jgi:hypothetical protein